MANKPKIRFKGFDDAWEQRKLDDVVEFLDTMRKPLEGAKRISGSYPYYGASGIVDYVDGYLFDEELILLSEDGANITDRNYPVCFLASGKYWVNNHAHVLRTKQGNENNFICNSLEQKDYTQYNTGMAMPKLNKETCKKIPVSCPEFKEQKKIGDYFRSLDHLITLHQRNCDQMKELKKYMLTKMFPQNGAKVPEIRFDGFIDDWEQRKLDDWGTFYYGKSCPKWSVTEDSTTPCIRYGELYTKFGAKIDRVYSYTNMSPENLRFSKGTEVLIPRVGEDPMDYNHCTWLSMPNVAIGEMISVFNTDNNPLFTAMMFNATLQNEFAMRVEGGSVTNLYFEKLKSIEVSFPSIPEQEKIAAYFDSIDHLITLHQHKCNELREIKKYMLKNMFI